MPTYTTEELGNGYTTPVGTPLQQRVIEYGTNYKPTIVNRLLEVIVGSAGKRIVYGLNVVKVSPTKVRITKGAAIKDYVLLRCLEDVELTIPNFSTTYYLVLRYRYTENLPTDDADFLFVLPTTYNLNPSLYLYLSTIVISNGQISSISYDSSIEDYSQYPTYTTTSANTVQQTSQPITYYVDSMNGSDSNDGSQEHPFRTIDAAIQKLPVLISHPVSIYLKGSSQPYTIDVAGKVANSDNAVITISGMYEVLSSGAVSQIQNYEDNTTTYCTLTDTTKNWIPDMYARKWVKIWKDDEVHYRTILSNTTNTLTLNEFLPSHINNTYNYDILDLSCTCNYCSIQSTLVPIKIENVILNCDSFLSNADVAFKNCYINRHSRENLTVINTTVVIERCILDGNLSTVPLFLANNSNNILSGCILRRATIGISLHYSIGKLNNGNYFEGDFLRCIEVNKSNLELPSPTNKILLRSNINSVGIYATANSWVKGVNNCICNPTVTPLLVEDSFTNIYSHITKLKIGGLTPPTSTLDIDGSISYRYIYTRSDLTLDETHYMVFVDCTDDDRELYLPDLANANGRMYIIKKTDSSYNKLTLIPKSGQTIEGQPNYVITDASSIMIIGDESSNKWRLLSFGANIGNLDDLYYRKTYLYTKIELQTPGAAQIHWDNIIGVNIDGGLWG